MSLSEKGEGDVKDTEIGETKGRRLYEDRDRN